MTGTFLVATVNFLSPKSDLPAGPEILIRQPYLDQLRNSKLILSYSLYLLKKLSNNAFSLSTGPVMPGVCRFMPPACNQRHPLLRYQFPLQPLRQVPQGGLRQNIHHSGLGISAVMFMQSQRHTCHQPGHQFVYMFSRSPY